MKKYQNEMVNLAQKVLENDLPTPDRVQSLASDIEDAITRWLFVHSDRVSDDNQ